MERLCHPVVEGGALGVPGWATLICSRSHRIALYRRQSYQTLLESIWLNFFSLDYISLITQVMSEWSLEVNDLHNENKYRIKTRKAPITILLFPNPQKMPLKTSQSSFPALFLYILPFLTVVKNFSPHSTAGEITDLFPILKQK